jgi:tetratricopeptide (TPR) repeat protein
MARKRRIESTTQVAVGAAAEEEKPRELYQDRFQQKMSKPLVQAGRSLEGKGKTILYGALALITLGIVGLLIYNYSKKQSGEAQAALGKAIETSQATVSESPVPAAPGQTVKSFKTEKERSEKALAEFNDVAAKYGAVADKAKYFAATQQLNLDREAGINQLTELAKSSDREVAALSKFALAEARAGEDKYDEAVALYQELAGSSNAIVPKDSINFELASIYEKQGKKTEAAELLFAIAKAGREAKGGDGKPLPLTSTAREAATKLEKIAPDKFKELPAEAPAEVPGGFPGMMGQ